MVVSNNQLLLSMENCTLLKIDLIDSSKQIGSLFKLYDLFIN